MTSVERFLSVPRLASAVNFELSGNIGDWLPMKRVTQVDRPVGSILTL